MSSSAGLEKKERNLAQGTGVHAARKTKDVLRETTMHWLAEVRRRS